MEKCLISSKYFDYIFQYISLNVLFYCKEGSSLTVQQIKFIKCSSVCSGEAAKLRHNSYISRENGRFFSISMINYDIINRDIFM